MTTNNATFSRLPVNQERDRQPESLASARPNPEILPNISPNSDLSGDIELDSLFNTVQAEIRESSRLDEIRSSLSNNDPAIQTEIEDLTARLASAKINAGIIETESVSNTQATIHVQERSRLRKMLAKLFTKNPALSEHALVNKRKKQLGGITGAMTGDQNKLMELNGSSAVF